ncbi:Dihydrofolate reductase [Streptoalloteichus tenebrarius]|uniref:Dihydrofolate reductase n=1 Tax=Streptoalloteichus tenebrarius (strain ATCC 17920 / DSM 40477 / JCM 4838 / CBS 697.72 / NBRC 16177 / NCIMB 11028 / NRRL B-12390 / A12253. 1 / ISP 5477) TaxID=1933 RepID=A0ABT1HNJ6_STRSD|nr:dihydrofolate reductase family protein [Streptoalloteichus tenebrarius]MCP2257082.1 Dihydrofolate reductase [Streptoalloteichus tenebrarius]BFE98714.1 dihydrofolate reductase family protein [Streptoalloteichus tenebrarius]
MRTFKLQVQTSVDGYMAGPNGEMDWLTLPWSDDLNAHVDALTEPVDCIVLGRKLAEGFIPAWASGPEGEPQESVDKMNNTPKVVISNTLTESPWDNATVAGGDLREIVDRLRAQPGRDMIAYGGGTLVSSLIAEGLLDELHLFVNPVALGSGMPVFPDLGSYHRLRLVNARAFDCGITALHFEPKRA